MQCCLFVLFHFGVGAGQEKEVFVKFCLIFSSFFPPEISKKVDFPKFYTIPLFFKLLFIIIAE